MGEFCGTFGCHRRSQQVLFQALRRWRSTASGPCGRWRGPSWSPQIMRTMEQMTADKFQGVEWPEKEGGNKPAPESDPVITFTVGRRTFGNETWAVMGLSFYISNGNIGLISSSTFPQHTEWTWNCSENNKIYHFTHHTGGDPQDRFHGGISFFHLCENKSLSPFWFLQNAFPTETMYTRHVSKATQMQENKYVCLFSR